jgi:hypothetical protein
MDQMEMAATSPVSAPSFDADVAQLVEQLIRNQQVTRSSRVVGSKFSNRFQVSKLQPLYQRPWWTAGGRSVEARAGTAMSDRAICWFSGSIPVRLTFLTSLGGAPLQFPTSLRASSPAEGCPAEARSAKADAARLQPQALP